MSNATRTLEVGQHWPDLSVRPETLGDCVRYLRTRSVSQPAPHTEYATSRCVDAASVMYIRHPEYFT